MEEHKEALELLVDLAKGQVAVGDLAGLDVKDKVKILRLGISHMQAGKDADAVRVLEGLVALDHKNPLFQEYLGLAYERVARLDDALGAYTQNLDGLLSSERTGARVCQAYMLRGRLQLRRGDKAAARVDLLAAQRHDDRTDAALSAELEMLIRGTGGEA